MQTIFEDVENELHHFKQRSYKLEHALASLMQENANLHEAGGRLQDAFEEALGQLPLTPRGLMAWKVGCRQWAAMSTSMPGQSNVSDGPEERGLHATTTTTTTTTTETTRTRTRRTTSQLHNYVIKKNVAFITK